MSQKDLHIGFKDCVSLSILIAAIEKSFPLFRRDSTAEVVQNTGKAEREKVFRTIKDFSTGFPQHMWKDK